MPTSSEHIAKGEMVDIDGFLNELPSPEIYLNALGVFIDTAEKDLFAETQRKAWDNSIEARCDFERKIRLTRRSGVFFISVWQKSLYGRTLTDIKADDTMVQFFADAVAPVITEILGDYAMYGNWAICTTPKRRHLVKNFATRISERIAFKLGIPFYEDVAICHSRQRVNAVFSLKKLPIERNIIVFDDFVTTGQTLSAMKDLLSHYHKNTIFFTGINNKI